MPALAQVSSSATWRAASQAVVRCTMFGVPNALVKASQNCSWIRYLPWPCCQTSLDGLSARILASRCGDFGERLVPRDLDPLRIFVAALLRVGALQRLLEAIRVVRVVHPRRALRADAVVVELGARRVRIDRAHDAVDDGRVDAAEVRADRAARLDVLDVDGRRGDSAFGGLRSLCSLRNGVEADAGRRDAATLPPSLSRNCAAGVPYLVVSRVDLLPNPLAAPMAAG